jgi:anti-anti-sigma regulatory factor
LLRAARRAHDNGRRLIVARPSRYVRRLLELTAIDQSLDIVDDVV